MKKLNNIEGKEIIIDGNNFSNLEEFYTEMDHLLTKNLQWKPGHNMDAFNDLLRGGFGVHEYGEVLHIKWKNADKSRKDFGYEATEKYYQSILTRCHPSNIELVQEKIVLAQKHEGKTIMDIIVEIILDTEDSGHYCTLEFVE